jgi:hypothetical protein
MKGGTAVPIFDDRKKSFEDQFRHEQELRFRITSRRNRLFGLWAAGHLGLSGAEADEYAKSTVMADFEKRGDEDGLAKVEGDFRAKAIAMTDAQLRAHLARFAREARQQVMTE